MPIGPGQQLPDFDGQTIEGQHIATRRYYLRSGLVLVFTHAWPCAGCRAYLSELDRHLADFRADRMEVLAVVPLEHTLVVDWRDGSPHFPIVLAEGDTVHRRFGFLSPVGSPEAAVVVTDDTGTIWQAWPVGIAHGFPPVQEVLAWARYVSYQCPECWETDRW
ncbi:redoxin domain-containing protein [Thermomicrobium sp. 4228-Ro]|uniref:redoxin domain-containing protein n=1 Tax=Thermomicrobium sp. 4228-Ro TaxID=2993937 RepID=UPI002248B1A5|nr:redoxin domain-containing protein [Thermomicrobium sp. 4228-Ro]MCX2726905.1 redoxin domain-containing protein [Thermomicrobium sp. 4228-Ro]